MERIYYPEKGWFLISESPQKGINRCFCATGKLADTLFMKAIIEGDPVTIGKWPEKIMKVKNQ